MMKHVIIGTAGHVDHGKTTLVKALTGIDTDRLEEEKRRGVTIELGFAFLDFDDGTRAGIIDVPGHERFIRNMLAGAGGIDLALLVVAADEGVMPQTREHLGILIQLGIGSGLVAVTKADNAEPVWLELVTDDIAELVGGTFLEGKPVIPVSALTGQGLPELVSAMRDLVLDVREKDASLPFRLPVDRVFPVDGFGVVVTGTLVEGSVSVGDAAEILPSGDKATVRNIQVHGENTETAYAGQRTAVNLSFAKRGGIKRGDVVAAPGALNVTGVADVRLNVLPGSKRVIRSGSGFHLYHGTRTLLANVTLLDRDELHGGENCYARLRLKEPLACKRGDRFVARFYSPLETIGGGVILDSAPSGRSVRRAGKALSDALAVRESGAFEDIACLAGTELGRAFSGAELRRRSDLTGEQCRGALDALVKNGRIVQLLPDRFISAGTLDAIGAKCAALLNKYHEDNPLRAGIGVAELRQKLMPDAGIPDASAVLGVLRDKGMISLTDTIAAIAGFSVRFTPAQEDIQSRLIKIYSSAGYDAPSPDELEAMFSKSEKTGLEQVVGSMTTGGGLIVISPQISWLRGVFDAAVGKLRIHFESNGELTLAECRDLLGTSRKYALAFLEFLDGRQVTKKTGDTRVILRGFDVLSPDKH